MTKILAAGLVTIISAFAFTTLPASADFSVQDAMAVCVLHHSHKHCSAMSHQQLMDMMACMGSSQHNNACH